MDGSCVWGVDGIIRCDKTCNDRVCRDKYEYFSQQQQRDKTNHIYSINIIVTNMDKTSIMYKRSLPSIESTNAYTIDTIILPDLNNNKSPGLLEIQDMTDYQGPLRKPPLLQLIIDANGRQDDMLFNSPYGLNILSRTATLPLKTIGTTRIIVNRIAMDLI